MQDDTALSDAPDIEIDAGYTSPLFISETTSEDGKVVTLHEPIILIHDQVLSRLSGIESISIYAVKFNKALLFIGGGISNAVSELLVVNVERGGHRFAAVEVSGSGRARRDILDAIATITGGMVFDEGLGVGLDNLATSPWRDKVLGSARLVRISKNITTILGGGGEPLTTRPERRVEINETASHGSTRASPSTSIPANDVSSIKLIPQNKRGPRGRKKIEAAEAMRSALKTGKTTPAKLQAMKEKELTQFYPACRTTLREARKMALSGDTANCDITPTNDK